MGIVVASHDDFVIVAEPSRVMSALAVAQDSFASKGLTLQSAKTKVAAFNPQVLQQCKQALHERRQTNLPHFGPANEEEEDGFWNEGVVFYGCAIGTPNFIRNHIQSKVEEVRDGASATSLLQAPVTPNGASTAGRQARWALLRQSVMRRFDHILLGHLPKYTVPTTKQLARHTL